MAHTITLIPEHVELLGEALIRSLEHKVDRWTGISSKEHLIDPTIEQYRDAMIKLCDPVRCGSITKNLFTWINDQLLHSHNLVGTQLQLEVGIITAAASKGPDYYRRLVEPLPPLNEIFRTNPHIINKLSTIQEAA